MEPFIGTILAFGFNFPPKGWAYCNGSKLPISQYTALFSLLGTYYGGDGKTNFALPDLQGRTAIGFSDTVSIGESGGAVDHTMTMAEMPAHNHAASSTIAVPVLSDNNSGTTIPTNNAIGSSAGLNVYSTTPADGAMAPFTVTGNLMPTGNSIPVQTISPYVVLNYSIALVGIFPSRN